MLCRLPGALWEDWAFDSPCLEGPDHWKTAPTNTPNLDRLIGKQASGRRNSPDNKGRGGCRRGEDHTVLRHLMVASDPINAVSGGSSWTAEKALREFASRTRSVAGGTVAEVLLDAPDTEGGQAAFSELCAALGVGLIIQAEGIRVVRVCERKNVWLERSPGGSSWGTVPWCKAPVGATTAWSLVRHKGRQIAGDGGSSMKELRNVARSCGIPTPLPRAKCSLADLILREVDDKAA